ncbi:hypothetical protein AYI82_18980 [Shewanella algae]|uniref:DUF2835 domain-containing protein n=1 Tax=Shewanella algae TaxID=38313 RepID=UPI001183971E|nr:DUF2835 domain-containing protein [Shewanella algae]TVL04126.1 hypothetical protein AYI82_18980 [Shewanella algae]
MEYYFRLNLSYQDFLPYYQGIAENVEVREKGGKILWINGRRLRPFLTADGIHGEFHLRLDRDGKFISLKQL